MSVQLMTYYPLRIITNLMMQLNFVLVIPRIDINLQDEHGNTPLNMIY